MEAAKPQGALGKKVLVVEDEEIIRKLCGAVLSRHGFEYILASDGAEGLQSYKDRHEEICLVLADVSMPVKSGLQMFREILEIHAHANVILMSGYNMTDVVPEDLKKLCSMINKPFTATWLIESINKCLKHDGNSRADAAHSTSLRASPAASW
jgi:DNA-binding NtrC family response regulator